MGASLLAMESQSTPMWLTHHREQARSYRSACRLFSRCTGSTTAPAAQLIMQDVIDDFAPHIETEIKRRLSARLERLLSQYND